MTIQEYYEEYKGKLCENIDTALIPEKPHYSTFIKNRVFLDDYSVWISVLEGHPENFIYKNAAKMYQESMCNMLMGLYQPAFMGLRYFFERTLMGIYFSASEIELRTWMAGKRDTYWSELIGEEDEDKSQDCKNEDRNVNKGLFSLKFTRAFFEEFETISKTFRRLSKNVYRECSEYVHGNPNVIQEMGAKIEYSEKISSHWTDCADTISRCILYAFMMRYWKSLSKEQQEMLIERLREEFSSTDIIKNYI